MRVKLNILPILRQLDYKPLTIVETGTIRSVHPQYAIGDGHSTLHIARFCANSVFDHSFHTIDLNTTIAKRYMEEMAVEDYVTFHEGNSLNILPQFSQIDVAYLDSANDADLILAEFEIVLPKTKHFIIIDDVDPKNKELRKGLKVLQLLGKTSLPYSVRNRQLVIRVNQTNT